MREYMTADEIAQIANPDIRLHSLGAAEAYGLRPMTEAGKKFIDAFVARTNGRWNDNIYWFHESLLPRDEMAASGLRIVAGVGETDEYDTPWRRL